MFIALHCSKYCNTQHLSPYSSPARIRWWRHSHLILLVNTFFKETCNAFQCRFYSNFRQFELPQESRRKWRSGREYHRRWGVKILQRNDCSNYLRLCWRRLKPKLFSIDSSFHGIIPPGGDEDFQACGVVRQQPEVPRQEWTGWEDEDEVSLHKWVNCSPLYLSIQ